MKSIVRLVAVLFSAAAAAASLSAQVNLLVNGSFETPALGSGTQVFSNGAAIGPGWFKTNDALGSTLLAGALAGYADAQDGGQRIQVGTNYTSKFYQEVTLTAGLPYLLTFFQSGVNGQTSGVSAGIFGNNGKSVSADHGGGATWTAQSLDFTPAVTGNYFVIFEATVTASEFPAVIDNVWLTQSAIPEPGTYAFVGGVLALGAVLYRRRRRAGN
jgi:hypothetical protein